VSTHPTAVRDLDHVVMTDGRIYRVVGNLDHPAKFVGYNVYSPDPAGDRLFRGTPYRKNFTEDDELPVDALDTYGMLPKARICEHLDPRAAATTQASTYADSPWAALHAELNALFGASAVGIFGSAMLGMHLTPDGTVRKDVDFVIEGAGNIPLLREHLPAIRSKLRLAAARTMMQRDIT
jgi:predicted nucleotidyltransferase